jgi:hypothetical protein
MRGLVQVAAKMLWMSGSAQAAEPGEQHVVSRESDLLVLRRFLGNSAPATCLVLSGEVGIGKTTLWETGIKLAAAQDYVVLSARAAEAEVSLSFASLADLVEGIEPDVLARLPAPQLHALEIALRRRDPVGAPLDPFAISAGFLGALRALAERGPVLVAVDDIQWVDPSSSDAVQFAARRSSYGRIRFMVTRRTGSASVLERVMPPALIERLEVAPLSFGATNHVLSERFGPVLTHRVVRAVYATSHGNPLFALELGRRLVAAGAPEAGAELPVPHLVEDVFGPRVRELSGPVRRALLALALSAGLSKSELAKIADPLAVEDAITAGLILVERSHVRLAHPMLAAATRQLSSARERMDLHLELASVVDDPSLRARHLAIATVVPSHDSATVVAQAADLALRRGAVQDAQELGAHALRLTPPGAPERPDRLLALGRFLSRADDMAGVTDLLTEGLAELPPGRARAMGHLLLGEAADARGNELHAELALAEGGDDPEIRALALAKKSRLLALSDVVRIDEAEAWALEAVSAAQQVGPEVEDHARMALIMARVYRGRPIDDLCRPEPKPRLEWSLPETSVDRALGWRLVFRGELEKARAIFQQHLALVDERGDLQSSRLTQQLLCDLELRAGNVRQAGALLDELGPGLHWIGEVRARLQALLAAVTGLPQGARRQAATVLETGSYAVGFDRLEATRAVGIAALFERDAAEAVEKLGAVWEHMLREHVEELGAFPVAADLVEALVQRRGGLRGGCSRLRRIRPELRPGPDASIPGRAPAPLTEAGSRAPLPRGGDGTVRPVRVLWLGHPRALGARPGERAAIGGRARTDTERAAGGGAGEERVVEQGDRRPPIRGREHGRGTPLACIRQARDPISFSTARQPGEIAALHCKDLGTRDRLELWPASRQAPVRGIRQAGWTTRRVSCRGV